MRNLKRLSVIAILVIASVQTQSQVRFGPKVGMNFSTMKIKSWGIPIDPGYLVGFQGGILSEISLGNFALQPAFLYSMKGSSYKNSSLEFYGKLIPEYLEIPINALYKIGAGPLKVMLMAGPYFSYGIRGKHTVTLAQETNEDAIKFGSSLGHDLKPLDIGINLGGGLEKFPLQLTVQYGMGFMNLDPCLDDGWEKKNKVVAISLVYLFGSK